MGKPKFGYWNVRGRGQAIRFMLAYLKVDYDEKRYTDPAEWFGNDKLNLGLDFPNLPYWIDDNVKLTETKAILKYLARIYGYKIQLAPKDSEAVEAKVDMLDCFINEIKLSMIRCCYDYTEEVRVEFDKEIEPKLAQLSKFLDGHEFILGSNISYLDFLLYETLFQLIKFDPNTLKSNPNLEQFKSRFEQLPDIKDYIASDKYILKPCIGPFAAYQKINE